MPQKVLGAILAGGKSTRFGSDKAAAIIGTSTLLQHAVAALMPQVEALAVCGREWPGAIALPDRPLADLGPLGGLNAALAYAATNGFDAVLSAPMDVYPLPTTLRAIFAAHGPQTLQHQYAVGYWPAALAPLLDAHLESGQRSFRSWIEASGAVGQDDTALALRNINRPDDLPTN